MLADLMPSINELININYEAIKSKETEQLIETSLQNLTSCPNPVILQISGIPGSGKSTYCLTHKKENYLFLSFDKIMTSLKGYQQELQNNGPVAAFEKYEMPARVIGYELLNRAIDKKINIMFEHSGTNQAHLELIKNITKLGYQAYVNFIICPKNLALSRAKKREKKTLRHVPESLIIKRAENLLKFVKAYQQTAAQVAFFDGTNNFAPLNKI